MHSRRRTAVAPVQDQHVAGRRHDERGASAVEFALLMPLFMTIIIGIISYGYMLSYRQTVSQAAAEGARAAAIAPSGLTAAQKLTKATAAVNDSLQSYGMTCSGSVLKKGADAYGSCSITVAGTCPSGSGSCATVTISHQYRDHPLVPSFPGLGVTLPQNLTFTSVVEVN